MAGRQIVAHIILVRISIIQQVRALSTDQEEKLFVAS
jgi:hypothetical protein